jgi:hypothetical protein
MMWVEAIKRLFSKPSRSTANVEGVRFVPATENAYGVDLWDCTVFTHSRISTTSDPNVASTFVRLRASLGSEYRNQVPASGSVTDCNLAYPIVQPLADGPLFKASEMEDKWISTCLTLTSTL